MAQKVKHRAVVALGGNAISPPDIDAGISDQFLHTRKSMDGIISLLNRGYQIAIAHGNGPQVGAALLRVENSREELPDIPLGLLVADTEGSMGYMIEQSLQNALKREKIERNVVTMITQVLVNPNDPALSEPTKYIGQIYNKEEAESRINGEGWVMKPYLGEEQWRRVVGSPVPISIINSRVIKELIEKDNILIVCGGGGIPVYYDFEKGLEGIDAVVDKDLAASILAKEINATDLIIITNVDKVRINFGKPDEKALSVLTISDAKKYSDEGQFPPGSMGPKIQAAIQFLENGGKRAIICELDEIVLALENKAGTSIIPS